MSVITDMKDEDYQGLLANVCPYCAAALPVAASDIGDVVHVIPNTTDMFKCEAKKLRTLRGEKLQTLQQAGAVVRNDPGRAQQAISFRS